MKKYFILLSVAVAPAVASAQGLAEFLNNQVGPIVEMLVPITSTLAAVFFFYGLAKYILNSEDEDARKEGKDIMIWGILAMFVIVTIWGIIGFIQATIGNTNEPQGVLDITIPKVDVGEAYKRP